LKRQGVVPHLVMTIEKKIAGLGAHVKGGGTRGGEQEA